MTTPSDDARLRAANGIAAARGFAAGFPNYHFSGASGGLSGHYFLRPEAVEWMDVRADFLNYPTVTQLGGLINSGHHWAASKGYASAIPTGHQASYLGLGQVFGLNMIRAGKAEVRSLRRSADLGVGPNGYLQDYFRAASDYAGRNGFAAGFPAFFPRGLGHAEPRIPVVLFRADMAVWIDISFAEVNAHL